MPIKKTWRLIGSVAAFAAALTTASPASAAVATTPPPVPPLEEGSCAHPALSQALSLFGDMNTYGLAPGGMFADASDWQLSGGATITSTTQPDGSTGGVLELPGTSQATSPPMCITADYPMARLWSRNVSGKESISFNVQYFDKDTGQWTNPKDNGAFAGSYHWDGGFGWSQYTDRATAWAAYKASSYGQWLKDPGFVKGIFYAGWRLSPEMSVTPSPDPGWQQVRFTLLAGGDENSRIQVDDFWVDPRASR